MLDRERKPGKSYRIMKSVNALSPGRLQCNGIRHFGPFGFSHPDCPIQTFVSITFLINGYPIRVGYYFATVPNLYKKVKDLAKPVASHWPVGPAQNFCGSRVSLKGIRRRQPMRTCPPLAEHWREGGRGVVEQARQSYCHMAQ